ncbi:MAG: YihY/virulence factor BrkB family protein [Pseudomonadota bacterium]
MQNFKNFLISVYTNIDKDDIFTRSAALAYYTALAMAPLIILLIWFLSTLQLDLQKDLIQQVSSVVGDEAAKLMATIISGTNERPDLSSMSGWIGLSGLLISASIIFVQLQTSLNLIFKSHQEEKPEVSKFAAIKDIIFKRIFSVGMLLTFIFIAIVSLAVSTSLEYFLKASDATWVQALNWIINFGIFILLFSVIFKWMPDRSLDYKSSIIGGLLTTTLFIIGKYLISIYLSKTAVGSAYGAAGSLIALLVWVYYSSLILFIGAEVSYVLFANDQPNQSNIASSNLNHG